MNEDYQIFLLSLHKNLHYYQKTPNFIIIWKITN